MKFTLKDYQDDAVRKVLANFAKASRRWHHEEERSSFALSAVTGAGKTVMAAAVFEALFYGSEEYDLEPDPTATVIWFSDDPSLNEQSRSRLMGASDRLHFKDLVRVEPPFSLARFEPGKIYFLNTQKLSANSLLVRGHDAGDNGMDPHPDVVLRPDNQAHTIWDTIRNTVEDEKRTLVLMLDEAHRGFGSPESAKEQRSTIVSRLINGHGNVPAIPVVWGISATVERFSAAMSQAENRTRISDVKVDASLVQESGLIKDTTHLKVPDEVGRFDSVLLREATEALRESSEQWAEYARQQTDSDPVKPLMVLQVPNTPKHSDIGDSIETILTTWPELKLSQIRHVFGDHTTLQFGPYAIPYIAPERIQDATNIRVVITKSAISTGWDAPRAEVLISFRPANEGTYIRQLIGRMIRTPLARRIPGSELLNSVRCYLPFFNRKTVDEVAEELRMGQFGAGDEPEIPLHRVVVNGIPLNPNPEVPEEVWEKFAALPSQTKPTINARPLRRLSDLAHNLSMDRLRPGAVAEARKQMNLALDAARSRYAPEIDKARNSVLTVEGVSYTIDLRRQQKSLEQFAAEADTVVIEEAYRRAAKSLGADFTHAYADRLAWADEDASDEDDALLTAHTEIAALGLVKEVKEFLDDEATKLSTKWLDEARIGIAALSDDRKDVYRKIREMSATSESIDLAAPRSGIGNPKSLIDGKEVDNPTYPLHLLSDDDGKYPLLTDSSWEKEVVEAELAREGLVGWYRNPGRGTAESLAVAYGMGGDTKLMRPDFLFFYRMADGSISPAIVDPHMHTYEDSLPKLEGLAAYAEQFGKHFHRIESVAKVGGQMRVLDLTDSATREAVEQAKKNDETVGALYSSSLASPYL